MFDLSSPAPVPHSHLNSEAHSTPAQSPPEPPRHPDEISRHLYFRDGEPVMLVLRLSEGKEERYYRDLKRGGTQWSRKKPDCFNPPHYHHDALMDEAIKDEPVFYVETEIQADALMQRGILATTFGTPGAYPSYEKLVLRGRDLIALGSNSETGSVQAYNILCQYGEVTRSIVSLTISSPISKSTPTGYSILDWLQDVGPAPDLKERLLATCCGTRPPLQEQPQENQYEVTKPAPKYRFPVQTPHRGMAKPEQKWLLDGILPLAGTVILFGDGGVGKSFLASEIAFAVQNGHNLGGRTTTPGEVIYFAVEDGDGLLRRALEALARDPKLEPYGIVSRELDLSRASKDTDLLIEELAKQFSGRQIRLIIIDTLQMALGSAEESSATDATAIMRNCNRISERLGCLVMLVHHTGKEASRGHRGSSAFHGAATTMIRMEGNNSSATVTVEKQKHGPRGLRLGLHLDDSADDRTCRVIIDDNWSLGKPQNKNAGRSDVETAILGILEQNLAEIGSLTMTRSDLRSRVESLACLAGKGEEAVKSQINRAITALHETGEIIAGRTSLTLADQKADEGES